MNIVLMAGGGGTRLWPLSRSNKPKQFLDLGTGKSLLEHTYERARAVTSLDKILVATTSAYTDHIRQMLPSIEQARIIIEADRRDTGPAIAAVAAHLVRQNQGGEPVIFMWSDHFFTSEKAFIADLRRLAGLIKQYPDNIILVGHRPTSPETTLGYIELGAMLQSRVYRVIEFKEKPNETVAQQYVSAGNFVWNMGYISCTPQYLLQQLQEHAPQLAAGIEKFMDAPDAATASAAYQALPRVSIDYALIEKTPRLLAVVGDYGWSDVGNWSAVQDVFGVRGDHMPRGHHIHVDSLNNYIYNATEQAITLLGVHNTIVVVTKDAVLITKKNQAYRVKEVVTKLEEGNRRDLL